MSALKFAAVTGQIATGTAAKTLLQIVAPANHRLKISELAVSFQGVNPIGLPILVQVARQSSAGTMSALTPVKVNDGDPETLLTTAQHTATAEPTTGDVLLSEQVHPQTGYTWQATWGHEIIIPGGGKLGIIVTADASVNAVARVLGEE